MRIFWHEFEYELSLGDDGVWRMSYFCLTPGRHWLGNHDDVSNHCPLLARRASMISTVRYGCTCKVGPGKFEGEGALTFMAWEQTMLGNADTTTGGEGNETDWLRSPLNLDADKDVVEAAIGYGYCQECVDEAGNGIGGGVAVWTDGNGFVYSETFDTKAEFDKALEKAEAWDAADADEDEEAGS